MSRFAPPAPPVVGGHPANNSGRGNHPATRVVIHSAVTPCKPGMARRLGEMNRDGSTAGSWHYATDPLETIQCSYDSYVCWHAPPNGHSIGIEMADWPSMNPGRWMFKSQRRMLRRTAKLTARLCLAYDLPIVWLDVAALRAGKRGITSHRMVSLAFGQSTHWDPGFWPRRRFMWLVRHYAHQITEAQRGGSDGGRSRAVQDSDRASRAEEGEGEAASSGTTDEEAG